MGIGLAQPGIGDPLPAVVFEVDCERIEVHTTHLTVREILDLVGADPAVHYLVQLEDPENIPHTILETSLELRDCNRYITVFTGETPLS